MEVLEMAEYEEEQYQDEGQTEVNTDQEDPTAPKPSDFDGYDQYVAALIDHRVKKNFETAGSPADKVQAQVTAQAVAQGVAQALQPQITFMDKLNAEIAAQAPDDELHGPRTAALDWIANCKQKEEEARLRGDVEAVHAWKQRAQWGVKDIKNLGKSQAEQYAEDVHDDLDFHSINQLFDEKTVDDKKWDARKMQHDAGIVISRANQRNRNGLIALPLESAPFGEVLTVHPKNMCQVQLPIDQFESWKKMVYHSGGDNTPVEVFKRSWRALRQLGYADTAIPAFQAKAKEKAEAETDPEKMTFAEFCRWREGKEKKRPGAKFRKRK
jgi:hypothetical protein